MNQWILTVTSTLWCRFDDVHGCRSISKLGSTRNQSGVPYHMGYEISTTHQTLAARRPWKTLARKLYSQILVFTCPSYTAYIHRVYQLSAHPSQPSSLISAVSGNNEVSVWDMETANRRQMMWASPAQPFTCMTDNVRTV